MKKQNVISQQCLYGNEGFDVCPKFQWIPKNRARVPPEAKAKIIRAVKVVLVRNQMQTRTNHDRHQDHQLLVVEPILLLLKVLLEVEADRLLQKRGFLLDLPLEVDLKRLILAGVGLQ